MALLSSCWLLIEAIIIPHGFRKWICLSFFIHPLILFACQLFLWLKLIKEWILYVASYPLKTIFIFGSYVFRTFRNWFVCFLNFFSTATRIRNDEHTPEAEKFESLQICSYNLCVGSHITSSVLLSNIVTLAIRHEVFEEEKECPEDLVLHDEGENTDVPTLFIDDGMSGKQYLPYDSSSSTEYENENSTKCLPACSSNSQEEDTFVDDPLQSACNSALQVVEREVVAAQDYKEDSDAFHKKYSERMRWFDILNYDRTCGTSGSLLIIALSPQRCYYVLLYVF